MEIMLLQLKFINKNEASEIESFQKEFSVFSFDVDLLYEFLIMFGAARIGLNSKGRIKSVRFMLAIARLITLLPKKVNQQFFFAVARVIRVKNRKCLINHKKTCYL